jgi:hypothetical protein
METGKIIMASEETPIEFRELPSIIFREYYL